jgi:hypothetical protein
MWRKIAIALVYRLLASVDWDALLCRLLARLEAEIKEQLGVTVGLAQLDRQKLLIGFEEIAANTLGINLDLNNDGVVGDGNAD